MFKLRPEGKEEVASKVARKHSAKKMLCAKVKYSEKMEEAPCGWNIEKRVQNDENWELRILKGHMTFWVHEEIFDTLKAEHW